MIKNFMPPDFYLKTKLPQQGYTIVTLTSFLNRGIYIQSKQDREPRALKKRNVAARWTNCI
jgi:hypothetical protein